MNKVIVGSGSSDLGKVVSARNKLRIMQQEDCIKDNIYYSHPRYGGDGLFYLCIRSGASSPSKPTPDYFDMTPISMEDIYKKLEDKIKGIDEKFKNFCPFPINSLFLTLGTENPHTLFLGTTWEKQEGRFLLGSSSSYALGSTSGNSNITLTEANIPRHRHQVDTVSATIPEHTHNLNIMRTGEDGWQTGQYVANGTHNEENMIWTTSSAGGGSTGAIAPYTNYVGNGTAFNNMPPYLVVNIWKRLT